MPARTDPRPDARRAADRDGPRRDRERAPGPIAESLADWLRDKRLLLVLDNFEQVISAGPAVAELLRAAPEIKAIVTSRAVLHVSGEQEYPVPGLPAPPDPSQMSGLDRLNLGGETRIIDPIALGQYAAVRLFIERAVAVRPGFAVTNENAPAVAAISARLHGMPLAIELAAARIKILSPEAILTRLDHQLDVLAAGSRDLPARQQTLRGAIAWSYDLLDDGGRRLLDRLSVFASGCDITSAEAICGPASELGGDILDGLMALVDQSLLKVDEMAGGEPRFRLLDTIREFAAERLEADGEVERIRARHRDWYVALVEEAGPQLSGVDQRRWLDRLELEHDDIRAVLDRAVEAPDPPVAIGVAFAMWRFWQKHGHLAEARRRLEAMEAAPWSNDDQRLRARLLEALGGTIWWQGEPVEMGKRYEEALAIWQTLGDEAELANAYYNASFTFAFGPDTDPGISTDPDPDRIGLSYLEEARDIYHRIGDARGEANALWGIGNYHYFRGYPGNGVEEFRATLEMFRAVGDLTMEAWSAAHARDVAAAQRRCRRGARACRPRDPPFLRRRRRVGTDPDARRPVGRGGRRWRPATRGPAPRRGAEPDDGDRGGPRRLRRGHASSRASGRASDAQMSDEDLARYGGGGRPRGRLDEASPTRSTARRPSGPHDAIAPGVGWTCDAE